jgi:hypothetical protein
MLRCSRWVRAQSSTILGVNTFRDMLLNARSLDDFRTVSESFPLTPQDGCYLVYRATKRLPENEQSQLSRQAWLLKVISSCVYQLDACTPKDSTMLLTTLAKLGMSNKSFIQPIVLTLTYRLQELSALELANTIWALATLNHHHSGLLKNLAQRAEGVVAEFKPRELAIIAWSFASLSFKHDTLLDKIALHAESSIAQANSQALSNLAWSYSKLKYPKVALFDSIAASVIHRLGKYTPSYLPDSLLLLF